MPASLLNVCLFLSGIFLFAFFIGAENNIKGFAFAALGLPVFEVYKQVYAQGNPSGIWSSAKPGFRLLAWLLLGIILAIFVGVKYRLSIHMPAYPEALQPFAITAAAIGATEEFIFRGVLFYLLKNKPAWLIIFISAVAHAGYKSLLFLSPFAQQQVAVAPLFIYTFIGGLILGVLRYYSKSTATPLLAHAGWDVVVYGDSAAAPWWVW